MSVEKMSEKQITQDSSQKNNVVTSRYIVAFKYDTVKLKYNELCKKNINDWELAPENTMEQDVYSYVSSSIIDKSNLGILLPNYTIGCRYKYAGLKNNFELVCSDKGLNVKFTINEMELILFQNGIGFLWYETHFKSKKLTAEEIINSVYHMKELARNDKNNKVYNVIFDNDTKEKKLETFSIGEWVAEILNSLNTKIDFYPSRTTRDGKKIPDKAVLFHYGLVAQEENLLYMAYNLTRGYKNSYRMTEKEEEKMLHPFENVYCFATIEGCGYYALASNDGKTFAASENKVFADYFLMYILVLYQSYSLLMYSEQIAEKLSADRDDYNDFSQNEQEVLERINRDINVFLAKSIYSSVSHIQHQNDFYEYASDKLRIKNNISSVSAGIEALKNLENKLEEDERSQRGKALEGILVLISLLSIFSTWDDVLDLFTKLFDCTECVTVSVNIIMIAILVIISITYLIMKIINKKRKNRN